MCNYYAVYLRHRGSAEAYSNFLRKNALKKGVNFFLYPKTYEFPKVFQNANFGVKPPYHFLGILHFGGDAAFFPKEFEWAGVILDHVYTQSLEADAWLQKRLAEIVARVSDPVAVVQRRVRREQEGDRPFPVSGFAFEDLYQRENRRWNIEEDEIKRLVADHKERVANWKRANSRAEFEARIARDKLEDEMFDRIFPQLQADHARWVSEHPYKSSEEKREYFRCMRDSRMSAMKLTTEFRNRMAAIERKIVGKPHKSQELKDRIKAHREHGERLRQMSGELEHEKWLWRQMTRPQKRHEPDDE